MDIDVLYRPDHALARCRLAAGESVMAESGALVGMSPGVELVPPPGGLMSGLKRMFGGGSFFRNTFTARPSGGEVLFATPLCGDMEVLDVGERRFCLQSSAYVASSPGVEVKPRTGGLRAFFSGAGLFVLEASGEGRMVIGAYGALERVDVRGPMVVDTGHVAAWESTLRYEVVEAASGWLTSWLGGEELVCRFEGEGALWLQSRNASAYGAALGAMLPPRRH